MCLAVMSSAWCMGMFVSVVLCVVPCAFVLCLGCCGWVSESLSLSSWFQPCAPLWPQRCCNPNLWSTRHQMECSVCVCVCACVCIWFVCVCIWCVCVWCVCVCVYLVCVCVCLMCVC